MGPKCLRPRQLPLIGYSGFLGVLALVFVNPLCALAIRSIRSDIHSHVVLIPLISGYLLFLRRNKLPKTYESSLVPAFVLAAIGTGAAVAAWSVLEVRSSNDHTDYPSLAIIGLVCLIAAGGFGFLGSRWMAGAAFPMAFLVFMVPLPDQALRWLELASQLASTEVAALFFRLTGTPMLRDGTVFQLPGIAIEVARECSGIRSSYALFITTVAAAFLLLQRPWTRAILIAFVIPLGIVRNAFRIWVIAMLCVELGPQMIHSFVHHQGGPLFFALSLIPLFLLLACLRRAEVPRNDPQISPIDTDGPKQARRFRDPTSAVVNRVSSHRGN